MSHFEQPPAPLPGGFLPFLPQREVGKIILDVLDSELCVGERHARMGDEDGILPVDDKLLVVVYDSLLGWVGACNFLDQDPTSPTYLQEVQQATAVHDLRVEAMAFNKASGGNDARRGIADVCLALTSIAAQQAMGQYLIGIGRPTVPVNASASEESGRLQKFVSHVHVTALHQRVKAPPEPSIFDKFNGATVDGSADIPQVSTEQ